MFFTNEINQLVLHEEDKLKVFDKNSPYLATKKIGKNNPVEEQIKADNEVRQEWNRTVDMAIVSGVSEEDISRIKKVLDVMPGANILEATDKQSYDKKQKTKAKVIVTGVLHPKMSPLASKYVQFKNIHKELQRQNEAIFGLERNRGNLEIELADCKGVFKSGKRTELQKQIDELDRMVNNMKRKLLSIVQEYGNWEKKQSGKSEDSSRINKPIENA